MRLVAEVWLGMQQPWHQRHPWSLALIGIIAALVLVAITGSGIAAIGGRGTTATVAPTPTPKLASLTPTPLPTPGFAYYSEPVSGFQVQYPQTWQVITKNPGVEFDDNVQNPTLVLQILLPSATLDLQTDWVQYEFSNLRQTAGTSNFQQVGDTTPMTIGGVSWMSGQAQLQQGATTIAVRVLATVHHDRAYIINLLAANMSMAAAEQQHFDAILSTFAFLS
jgi:hypothetical protein